MYSLHAFGLMAQFERWVHCTPLHTEMLERWPYLDMLWVLLSLLIGGVAMVCVTAIAVRLVMAWLRPGGRTEGGHDV